MHDSQEGCPRHAASEASDDAGLQVDYECIPEALVHERYALTIGRDVRSFPEISELLKVRRKMLQRIPWLSLRAERKRCDEKRSCNFHVGHAIRFSSRSHRCRAALPGGLRNVRIPAMTGDRHKITLSL